MKIMLNERQYNVVSASKERNLHGKLLEKEICSKILPVIMFYIKEI